MGVRRNRTVDLGGEKSDIQIRWAPSGDASKIGKELQIFK